MKEINYVQILRVFPLVGVNSSKAIEHHSSHSSFLFASFCVFYFIFQFSYCTSFNLYFVSSFFFLLLNFSLSLFTSLSFSYFVPSFFLSLLVFLSFFLSYLLFTLLHLSISYLFFIFLSSQIFTFISFLRMGISVSRSLIYRWNTLIWSFHWSIHSFKTGFCILKTFCG